MNEVCISQIALVLFMLMNVIWMSCIEKDIGKLKTRLNELPSEKNKLKQLRKIKK